jgi:hypothetical protein
VFTGVPAVLLLANTATAVLTLSLWEQAAPMAQSGQNKTPSFSAVRPVKTGFSLVHPPGLEPGTH